MVTVFINCNLSIHFSHMGILLNVTDTCMQMEMQIFVLGFTLGF